MKLEKANTAKLNTLKDERDKIEKEKSALLKLKGHGIEEATKMLKKEAQNKEKLQKEKEVLDKKEKNLIKAKVHGIEEMKKMEKGLQSQKTKIDKDQKDLLKREMTVKVKEESLKEKEERLEKLRKEVETQLDDFLSQKDKIQHLKTQINQEKKRDSLRVVPIQEEVIRRSSRLVEIKKDMDNIEKQKEKAVGPQISKFNDEIKNLKEEEEKENQLLAKCRETLNENIEVIAEKEKNLKEMELRNKEKEE